jgi:hypothetical protein
MVSEIWHSLGARDLERAKAAITQHDVED